MWFLLIVMALVDRGICPVNSRIALKPVAMDMLDSHEADVIDVIKDEKPIKKSISVQRGFLCEHERRMRTMSCKAS